MSKHLLVVEDESHLAFALEFNLQQEGYHVHVAESLGKARQYLANNAPDLIILDVMLPDGTGFELCTELRSRADRTPVLMLTARGSADDIVTGLESGADDYMTKPFVLKELLGRVAAILRRQEWAHEQLNADGTPEETTLSFGENTINFTTHEVLVSGESVELTDLEQRLLRFFATHQGRVIPREELLEKVWKVSPSTHTRTVDNFLVRLRRLFEHDPANPQHFLTISGVGYRFVRGS